MHLVSIDNYDEFKSGDIESENLSISDLISLHNSIRNDGLKFGLNSDRYKYVTKFSSIEEALKKTQAIYSSAVACYESFKAAEAEEIQNDVEVTHGDDNSGDDGSNSRGITPTFVIDPNGGTGTGSVRSPKIKTDLSKEAMARIPKDAVITVLALSNPKRRGAADRFDLYFTGMTVKEYLDKVGETQGLGDILWDSDRGWIKWN
jgi:hypothetical protein